MENFIRGLQLDRIRADRDAALANRNRITAELGTSISRILTLSAEVSEHCVRNRFSFDPRAAKKPGPQGFR